ncbi:MAG: sulfatase-like hydrolase/transferase, partial [Caldilineaceae bacterium]|nr:sulfatase-like hydrolase/transferase [Caldilineaceae bacterium]
PWALFLSFVCPHPPYIAPPELYDRYPLDQIPMPPQWRTADWPDHPAMAYFRRFFGFDPQFAEREIRRMNAAYYGACTWLDQQIGRVLSALD